MFRLHIIWVVFVACVASFGACGQDPVVGEPDVVFPTDMPTASDTITTPEDSGIVPDGSEPDTTLAPDTAPDPVDTTQEDVGTVADVTPEDTSVVEPDTTPVPEDVPKSPMQNLCETTSGVWLMDTCGHWQCGVPPECKAIIPGCNCGEGKVFDGAQGCVEWDGCLDEPQDGALCEDTGGKWLEDTCGDWVCGAEPMCDAIIPGCNCGPGRIYDAEDGCILSDKCGGDDKESLCVDTGGQWLPTTCGDWKCGVPPLCKAIVPGCNCGKGKTFKQGQGCIVDPGCNVIGVDKKEQVCTDTGGKWLMGTCGDWVCGEEPPCEAIKPGCNCGKGKTFTLGEGCQNDPKCEDPADDPKQSLCLNTGGKWLPLTCGDWTCGAPPVCKAIIPGCNCGTKMSFKEGLGCQPDPNCGNQPLPNGPQSLCEASGGIWHPDVCGHYECGIKPGPCNKPYGGCDCGEGQVLVKEVGCVKSPICQGATLEELCLDTDGKWLPDTCGHWICGNQPTCEAIKPGCNCGKESLFIANYGCVKSKSCGPVKPLPGKSDQKTCEMTGGKWDKEACGDYKCGTEPNCDDAIGGCDCGDDKVYEPLEGCMFYPPCTK